MKKCKKCGHEVPDKEALAAYEEFFEVLCTGCAAEIRASQEIPQGASDKPQAGKPGEPWQVYRQGPDGPIYQTPERADLPPDAIFQGYNRPRKGGPVYQLFTIPPKVDPATLDKRARTALEAGGFTFEEIKK